MPFVVVCSNCVSKLKVNETAIGRKVRCPKCGDAVPVQEPDDAPAALKPAKRRDDQEEVITVKKRRPREPEPESYTPEESAARSEESRPRKRKKKKRRRQVSEKAGVPGWVWWTAGLGSLCLALVIGAILLVQAGHGLLVLGFAISLPISAVIMIVAMILSSALGGGIYFGELGEVIVKSLLLVLIIDLVFLIPFAGRYVAFLVLLIGSMVLFELDIWEARFFVAINWLLNFIVNMFLLHVMLAALTHGRLDEDRNVEPPHPPNVSRDEEKILNDIKAKGGDYDFDDNEQNPAVVTISFEGQGVTDADLSDLKIFKKLTALDLPSTQITDAGLDHVKEMSSLRQLDLSGTRVTDKGIAKLKGLKQLRVLNLGGTKVTKKAIQDLQKALPQLQVISLQVDRQNQRPNRPFP